MSETLEHRDTRMFQEETNMGSICIAEDVIAVIAGLAATETEGVSSIAGNVTNELVSKLGMKVLSRGVKIERTGNEVTADISLCMEYGYNIMAVSEAVQEKVKQAIMNMTGLTVIDVNIRISGVNFEK